MLRRVSSEDDTEGETMTFDTKLRADTARMTRTLSSLRHKIR